MDRNTWLREMRRECEEKYDQAAPLYGEKYGLYNNTTQQQFIRELLSLLPRDSTILDAACGAGRYLPFLLEKEHSVVAIDQSQGMLTHAMAKFPGVRFEKAGLQEISYRGVFDGVICMDAMENVCPEDWPLVLGNFHGALKEQGFLYFTAETIENTNENEVQQAFERAQRAGLPVVYGEWPDEEVYHFHPTNQQVKEWTRQAGFEILKEGNGEIYYYHILARKAAS
ncbi:MAG TPA: class I SAM-dependent methyltransferase [Anaerolineales bacterium]|nr:class I SAM-dependent methyltransferase [Anaerolineales bacterium]